MTQSNPSHELEPTPAAEARQTDHRRALGVLVIGLSLAPAAHAYVDPGTGMMAIQALIALGIGVVAFVRHPIQTLKRWWARLRGRSDDHA